MYLFIVYRYSTDMYAALKQFYRKHLVFYFKEPHDQINWWKMNLIQIMIQGLWSGELTCSEFGLFTALLGSINEK